MPRSTRPKREDLEAQTTKLVGGGEKTGKQPVSGGSGLALMVSKEVGAGEPPKGTFKTYREMRRNPTIAMARVAATAPIKSADITFKKKEGVTDAVLDFIEDQVRPYWRHFCSQSLNALDFGVTVFEIVYGMTNDGGPRITVDKLKPLWIDDTVIQIDDMGRYQGVKQGKIELPAEKTLRYSYDVEGTNWWGRSRHENVRQEAWTWWRDTARKLAAYGRKVAGVVPLIMYPEGRGRNEAGQEVDNFDLAKVMLDRLGNQMAGIAMPNAFANWAGDLLKRGVDLSQLRPWLIQFLEPAGQHGGDFVTQLNYWDRQLARGWLVPERTFQEGEHGTKAEAGVHGDIVLSTAEEILMDLTEIASFYLVDRIGVLNFPNYQPGDVWIAPGPIIDTDKAFMRSLIEKVASGAGLATLLQLLDLEAMIEQSGLPINEDSDGQEIIANPDDDDESDDLPPDDGRDSAAIAAQGATQGGVA